MWNIETVVIKHKIIVIENQTHRTLYYICTTQTEFFYKKLEIQYKVYKDIILLTFNK